MILNKGFTFKFLRMQTSYIKTQMLNFSSAYKENKIIVKNYEINYLKVGHGPHHVLCAPCSLGSIWTDFKPQIEEFDREKFSLIVFDPPGCGKTVKLGEDITQDIFRNCSYITYHFMQSLQISKYSYLGWSFGGIAGIILAGLYPDVVEKLVIWGAGSFYHQHEIDVIKKLRDINKWPKSVVSAWKQLYGEKESVERVEQWIDKVVKNHYSIAYTSDVIVHDVKCPTFIFYGEKDPMVDKSHGPYLLKKIKNSRLHVYPEGRHNLHIKHAEDFNKKVQDFLLEA